MLHRHDSERAKVLRHNVPFGDYEQWCQRLFFRNPTIALGISQDRRSISQDIKVQIPSKIPRFLLTKYKVKNYRRPRNTTFTLVIFPIFPYFVDNHPFRTVFPHRMTGRRAPGVDHRRRNISALVRGEAEGRGWGAFACWKTFIIKGASQMVRQRSSLNARRRIHDLREYSTDQLSNQQVNFLISHELHLKKEFSYSLYFMSKM